MQRTEKMRSEPVRIQLRFCDRRAELYTYGLGTYIFKYVLDSRGQENTCVVYVRASAAMAAEEAPRKALFLTRKLYPLASLEKDCCK